MPHAPRRLIAVSTALASAAITLAGPAAADTTTTLNAVAQGDRTPAGTALGGVGSGTYQVGADGGFLLAHGYAGFDLSSVSGQITSARLTLPNTSCGAGSNAAAGSVVNVWDVSTPADQFGPTPPNPALYGDLGGGTSYGSAATSVINQPDVTVAFGTAGLDALQTGEGQSGFFVGLSLAGTPNQQIFAQSTVANGCIPTLAITVADVVDTSMLSAGIAGLAVVLALLGFAVVLLRRRSTSSRRLDV